LFVAHQQRQIDVIISFKLLIIFKRADNFTETANMSNEMDVNDLNLEKDDSDDGADRFDVVEIVYTPVSSCFCRRIWTAEEDEAIRVMVAKFGTKSWALIADNLQTEFSISGRSGKQCRERWHNHLGKNHTVLFLFFSDLHEMQILTSTKLLGPKKRRQ
jgi:hypothetical protein